MAISVVELRDKPLPADDWIIEGLLTRKNTGLVIGPPKKGNKSWMLLNAAWDLSEGKDVWGVPQLKTGRQMRTIYFTQEDSEANIQERVKLVVGGGREVNDRVWIVPKNLNIKLDTHVGADLVKRELDQVAKVGPIDLVVFDPMRRIHDGEENDSQTIAKLWHRLDAIHNDYNCATLLSHHIVKPPLDRAGYDPTDPYHGRGSGDIYGGGDAFVVVVPQELLQGGSGRKLKVAFESKRGGQLPSAVLKMSYAEGRISWMGQAL